MEGMFGRIGQALAIIRQERGISQYDLADRCRIGRSQVSKYEAGRELMKLDTLEKILRVLGIEPDQFFRLVTSLDDSLKPVPAAEKELRNRKLQDAFVNLHSAIDQLQYVIERSQSQTASEGACATASDLTLVNG
jgi:transcriptional regulator with XRE-family HTH domain